MGRQSYGSPMGRVWSRVLHGPGSNEVSRCAVQTTAEEPFNLVGGEAPHLRWSGDHTSVCVAGAGQCPTVRTCGFFFSSRTFPDHCDKNKSNEQEHVTAGHSSKVC